MKTTDEILKDKKIISLIKENYGDMYLGIIDSYAKPKNYKENIFYHATGGFGESGAGKGLYLGKDWEALNNFYNSGGFGDVEMYEGNANFLDLVENNNFENFEILAINKFGRLKNNEHLGKMCLEKGFDGIRYFDICATGEEFVLYNTSKMKFIRNVFQGEKILTFI